MKFGFLFLTVIWSLLLFSCREVTFSEPQPAGIAPLTHIDSEIIGRYLARDPQTGEKADTVIIESWGYHFTDAKDKDWLGRGVISDSLVVKSYKDYLFVNFKAGDQWVLRLLKKLPNGDLQFLAIDLQGEDKGKSVLKRLAKKVKVTEIKRDQDTYYQISPSPAQLMALINEGFFTGTTLERKK